MFQYATGRALAIQKNTELKLDTTFLLHRISMPNFLRPNWIFRQYDLDLYNIKASIASPSDMKWWQRPITSGKMSLVIDALLRKGHFLTGWEKKFSYDENLNKLKGDIYIAGFWQSPKYFNSIREELLQEFTLVTPLPTNSQIIVNEMKEIESVGLFVRRADIASKKFHGEVEVSYYVEAFNYLKEKKSIKKIYVFSDDLAWCKANLSLPIEMQFIDNDHAGKKWEGHMTMMKYCKHFIIANSTFAWWAAWLGENPEKIVIAPKKWFGNATIDTQDLIPEEWIRL